MHINFKKYENITKMIKKWAKTRKLTLISYENPQK